MSDPQELLSAATSYGVGGVVAIGGMAANEIAVWLGVGLVAIRLLTDIPKMLGAWRNYRKGSEDDRVPKDGD